MERRGTKTSSQAQAGPRQTATDAAEWDVAHRGNAHMKEGSKMSTAFAHATEARVDSRRSAGTWMDAVPRAHIDGSHATVRVLIANHQPIVRHGLRTLIASEPDLEVI